MDVKQSRIATYSFLVLTATNWSGAGISSTNLYADPPVSHTWTEPTIKSRDHSTPEESPWVQCQSCRESPGTLFQWNYDTSFSGGPNLDESLVTDRPDFTEAGTTVGCGVAQLEFGYTYILDDEPGTTLTGHSIGEPLLRFGVLANWLEFRIGLFPTYEQVEIGGVTTTRSGVEDLYVGFKIGLTPQECILPEMSLIPQMTVPTGSSEFSNDEVLPGVNWIYSWDVTEVVSVAGSTQGNWTLDEVTGKAYLAIAQSATAAFGLTNELGMYTEWFAYFPSGSDTAQTEHYFNGGFTYLVSNDVQFDIRAGLGLNRAADDFFAGAGLSIRFR